MYKDANQWQEIRHRVLNLGVSKRQIVRETGMAWSTLQRILAHPLPQPYKRQQATQNNAEPPPKSRSQEQVWRDILQALTTATVRDARFIVSSLSAINHSKVTKQDMDALKDKLLERGIAVEKSRTSDKQQRHQNWLIKIMLGAITVEQIRSEIGDRDDLPQFVEMAKEGNLKQRNRALSILALFKGISLRAVAKALHIQPNTVNSYWKQYRKEGIDDFFKPYRSSIPKKAERKAVQDAVFSVLHSPPSEHDINRTTWKMADLKSCLAQQGQPLSRDVIRDVIRSAGYRWRKARIVLTSTDPEYRTKLKPYSIDPFQPRKRGPFFSRLMSSGHSQLR